MALGVFPETSVSVGQRTRNGRQLIAQNFYQVDLTRVCDDQKLPKKIPICINGDALLVSSLDVHPLCHRTEGLDAEFGNCIPVASLVWIRFFTNVFICSSPFDRLARRASATSSGKTIPVAKLTRDSVLALNGLNISSDEKQRISFFTSSSSRFTLLGAASLCLTQQ